MLERIETENNNWAYKYTKVFAEIFLFVSKQYVSFGTYAKMISFSIT